MKIQIRKIPNTGRWVWKMKAENNRIVAISFSTYSRARDAKRAVKDLIQTIRKPKNF